MEEPTRPEETRHAGGAPSGDVPVSVDLDELLARRHSPARRAAGAAAVLVALLLASVVILRPQLPGILLSPAAHVTPQSTPLPSIAIQSNVNYGVLSLNGRSLGAPPAQGVRPRAGRNVIALVAPPLNARSCVLVSPITTDGRGSVVNPETTCQISVGNGQPEITVTISLDTSNLAPVLRSSALSAAEAAIASYPAQAATVPAGQYFVVGVDQQGLPLARRATSPLMAAVRVSVDTASADVSALGSRLCPAVLCAGPTDPGLMPSRDSWLVDVAATVQWRFTDATGTVVASPAFPATGDILLDLTYAPASGWQMAPAQPSTGPLDLLASDVGLCNQAYAMLEAALNTASQLDSLEVASGNPRDVLRGCRLHATYGGNSDPTDFIWRFGALLAVDGGAHKLLPQLPLAPAGEIAAIGG